MEKITCAAELKLAIQTLEFERDIQGQMLKEKLLDTFESLKPVNMLKNSLHEITSSPYLIDNMLGSVLGLVSGYVSRKIAVGTSHNLFRKITGTLLQFGITNIVAQHPDILKTVGNFVIEKVVHKNRNNKEMK